jgi:hypothetical protein
MCKRCGQRKPQSYDDFRTGLTFAEVVQMLKVDSEDPKDWRYKRRHTVLGFWRMIKQGMYDQQILGPWKEYHSRPRQKKGKVPF